MSEPSSPSIRSNKPTVKISETVLARSSTINLKPSRLNLHSKASYFFDTERFQARSAVRVDSRTLTYEKLKVTASQQYFRDDWGGVTAIRFLPDGERTALGFNSGELVVCSPSPSASPFRSGPSETIARGWEGNDSVSCIRFHPKKPSLLFASSTNGSVFRRDLEDNYNDRFLTEPSNEIYSMDFTANCELVTVGRDATVRVNDVAVDKVVHEFGRVTRFGEDSLAGSSAASSYRGSSMGSQLSFHEKRIYCVRCHPTDPAVVVTGGWDGVKVWDVRMGVPVRTIDGPFIFGDSLDLCKGTILTASCEAEDTLQLWDVGSGFLLDDVIPSNKRVYLYGEYPYVAQFYKGDPTGDMILYGVGGLQLISVKESSILYLIEDERPVVAVDSGDKKVSFGGKSNSVMNVKLMFPESDTTSNTLSFASRTISSRSDQSSVDTVLS